MSEIIWLPAALSDIARLHNFLESKNPQAAPVAVAAIRSGGDILVKSPRLGRPMPDETGRREFFVPFGSGSYILRYKAHRDDTVVVIRVWHSREDRE